jgi:hypothetical protein
MFEPWQIGYDFLVYLFDTGSMNTQSIRKNKISNLLNHHSLSTLGVKISPSLRFRLHWRAIPVCLLALYASS